MNHGLGDALMESAIKLEKLFYEKFPEIYTNHKLSGVGGKLTLGNKAFEDEVQQRLPGKSKNLFKYFIRTRNSIIHYGDSEKNIRENEEIRKETSAEDIRSAGIALLTLLGLAIRDEDKIREACEYALTKSVFDKVFGSSGKSATCLPTTGRAQSHANGKNSESNKVLDLLDGSQRQSGKQGHNAEIAKTAATNKLDKAKGNPLDLFTEDDKSNVRNQPKEPKKVLGGVTNILDQTPQHPKFIKGGIATDQATEPADYAKHTQGGEPRAIVIRPPILVPDLAARLGLKPFNVLADLIKLGLFPMPNQPIEPEVAAQVCQIHGFTFEREKKESSPGKEVL